MNGDNLKLDIIGVGMPRCGTTWLSKCLKEHPQICFSKDKETHFFDTYYKYRNADTLFDEQYKHCSDNKLKVEFTTTYTESVDTLKIIKKSSPNAKILFVVRNPYDRVFSHYLYRKRKNGTPKKFSDLFVNDPKQLLDKSLYAKHLERVLSVFDRKDVIVLNHDDARKDQKRYIQYVYNALRIDDNFSPVSLKDEVNRSKDLHYHFPFFEYLFTYRMKLRNNFFGKMFISFAKKTKLHNLLIFLRNKNIEADEEHVENEFLSDEDKEKLHGYFINDIIKFEKMSGLDLSDWKR